MQVHRREKGNVSPCSAQLVWGALPLIDSGQEYAGFIWGALYASDSIPVTNFFDSSLQHLEVQIVMPATHYSQTRFSESHSREGKRAFVFWRAPGGKRQENGIAPGTTFGSGGTKSQPHTLSMLQQGFSGELLGH